MGPVPLLMWKEEPEEEEEEQTITVSNAGGPATAHVTPRMNEARAS